MAVPCNSKWLMTIYLYNINNMFFPVLCADSEVLDRMNCPPLCAINPTNHAVLLLVGFENTLSAPDHVLPFSWDPFGVFCSPQLWGRTEGDGSSWPMLLWAQLCQTKPGLFSPPSQGYWEIILSPASPELGRMESPRCMIYSTDQNHAVKTWKYLNNFLFNFNRQPWDSTCARAALHNVCQLASAYALLKM